jgi:hypothetical protein
VDGTSIDSHGDADADEFLRGYQKGRSSWRSNRKPIQSYSYKLLPTKMKNKMQLIQNIAKHITLSKGEGVIFVKNRSPSI